MKLIIHEEAKWCDEKTTFLNILESTIHNLIKWI